MWFVLIIPLSSRLYSFPQSNTWKELSLCTSYTLLLSPSHFFHHSILMKSSATLTSCNLSSGKRITKHNKTAHHAVKHFPLSRASLLFPLTSSATLLYPSPSVLHEADLKPRFWFPVICSLDASTISQC